MEDSPVVGRVIGTEDATPLEFWVGVHDDAYLQLDDVVALQRVLPGGELVRLYGVVSQVRTRHDGVRFDSDVFLVADGVLPAEVSEAAQIQVTRFEPEVFVPPRPGEEVRKASGAERDIAFGFDDVERRIPAGLSRDGEVIHLDVDFLDGTKGAHVNISGISGVATKTSYATFLLYGLFHSGALGADAMNTKALVFNVKGEDLLFLDHPNAALPEAEKGRYAALGLPATAFASVRVWAPPRRDEGVVTADVTARSLGVQPYIWTILDFCEQGLLPFLFADAEDDRQQYTMVVQNVAAELMKVAREHGSRDAGTVTIAGTVVRRFDELVTAIGDQLLLEDGSLGPWAPRAITGGTVNAFLRRLAGAQRHVQHLIRADVGNAASYRVDFDAQVTVIDIHSLNDRAQRFVVGVLLRQAFDRKERAGTAKPLQLIVLDELNKYAPREGSSPIKEILLDVAERGRSLGIVLLGCQQTASEVERRVVANSAIRVVGRLDAAEAGRGEYGFLPMVQRQRATIIRPGTMIVSQPKLPVPVVLEFPFPAWATRSSEAGENPAVLAAALPANPLEGLPQ